jgi:HEAT repeat protein
MVNGEIFTAFFGNTISIMLFIIFLITFFLGTLLIYLQVSLVLKGAFKLKDRLQCIVYGFIFSMAIMIVMAMAFIFATKTPEFWKISETKAPIIHPYILIIPFFICLIYISFYPLGDFLFIALSDESDEGLTPFQRLIGEKFINKSDKKLLRILLAIMLYFLFFFLPPFIISLMGVPLLIIWITWMLAYPLMILTFYGSKGYISGVFNLYYHIPDMKRSLFLGFEDTKRSMKEFLVDPAPRIIIGLMIFVYIWAWISMFQTIEFFFTGVILISPYPYAGMVFVTLLFGIIGYFTRFWGRKIKYRGIDIYFAAYLMAAVGINVLVNFLILNANKLFDTFKVLNLTSNIIPNYLLFAWAAAIEELFLIAFISYYFLAKNNEFTKNIKFSIITKCGQTFDPIPLFNFIKNDDLTIKNHAKETLTLMYERIPLKTEINLNDMKIKNPLVDALSDPHPDSQKIAYQILIQLENKVPEIIFPWIIEAINSPNYDKAIPFARSLLTADLNLIKRIPESDLFNLLYDSEWRLKLIGLKIISRLLKLNYDLINKLNLDELFNDTIDQVQVETLDILANTSVKIPIEIIIKKISHPNKEIRAAAIKNLKRIDNDEIDADIISVLKSLIKDPTSSVRASVIELLAKIGNFKQFEISILPFLNGLIDEDKTVREASVLALERYYYENPTSLDIDLIIKKIDPNNNEILNSVLSLLGRLWEKNPEKILMTFLIFIKFDNEDLKENISNIIAQKYESNPDLIIQNLIKIQDVSKFITKGIIAKTIIKIGRKFPRDTIPLLNEKLKDKDETIRFNAISSLEGLVDEYFNIITIESILYLITNDKNQEIKREASKIIFKIAKKDPLTLKPAILSILASIKNQEATVKIAISKSLQEIAKDKPEILSVNEISDFFSDKDAFIRESGVKILGYIGYKAPEESTNILINQGIKDNEWIIRDAAISSLGKIIDHVDNKELIIKNLIPLIEDDNAWVRRSVMNILSNIKDLKPTQIPFDRIKSNLSHDDPKVREASTNMFRIYGLYNINMIFENPLIIHLLEDESKDVRNSMINSIVDIIKKNGLSQILSNLLMNMSDESSMDLQRSIAIILGRTAKYEDERVKKRVISILKIRCEMSQDPIICENLNKLRHN